MDETKQVPAQSAWAEDIQKEMVEKGLSRRRLLDRLKVAGVGFGAAVALGANEASAKTASLSSTNKVLNDIVAEGKAVNDTGVSPEMDNFIVIRRFYRRGYRRFFFRRFYRRFFRRF